VAKQKTEAFPTFDSYSDVAAALVQRRTLAAAISRIEDEDRAACISRAPDLDPATPYDAMRASDMVAVIEGDSGPRAVRLDTGQKGAIIAKRRDIYQDGRVLAGKLGAVESLLERQAVAYLDKTLPGERTGWFVLFAWDYEGAPSGQRIELSGRLHQRFGGIRPGSHFSIQDLATRIEESNHPCREDLAAELRELITRYGATHLCRGEGAALADEPPPAPAQSLRGALVPAGVGDDEDEV
jgi:hypothetical protein